MLRIFILFITVLLSGCAAVRENPKGDVPTAMVRFATLSKVRSNNIEVRIFKNLEDICKPNDQIKGTWVAALAGIALDHHREDLSVPLGEDFKKNSKTEILVESGKPLIYSIGFGFVFTLPTTTGAPPPIASLFFNTGTCKISKSFLPEEGRNYEVTYSYDEKECVSNVYEIAKDNYGNYIRQPIKTETNPTQCKKP